jgi:hypothetical protein
MSTTSCPRCSGQVTLPVGVSNSAMVRCPLCRAHYSLADALVNMPPLLEIVETGGEGEPADWFAAPGVDEESGTSEASTIDSRLFGKSSTDDDALALDDEASEEDDSEKAASDDQVGDEVEFAAEEATDEDLALRGSDTEIEELSFSTFDSVTPDAPAHGEPKSSIDEEDADVVFDLDKPAEPASGGDDDLELEFGEGELPSNDSESETVFFGEPQPLAASDDLDLDADASNQTATGASATIDFDAPQVADGPAEDDEVQFDFDEPQRAEANEETVEFAAHEGISFEPDLDQPVDRNEPALGEFGDLQFNPSGEGEDIALDVPDEPVAAPVAADAEQEADAGKKKGKKKKEKAVKASANGKPKRSLVGTLARVVLPLLIAVPMAAYVALWISPGLDYLGLGSVLPKMMLPSGFSRYKGEQYARNQPPVKGPDFGAIAASANFRPPDETSAEDAESTPGVETPADEPPALGPDLTNPAEAQADAPADSADEMPAKDEAAPAADDPFGDSQTPAVPPEPTAVATDDPFAADEAPEKMPAEAAAPAADDPFAEPKAPEGPSGVETPPAPADDPFGAPAPGEGAAPDAATSPAAEDPFAPAPDAPSEKPAADDPFAPSAPVETLPEPDQPAVAVLGPLHAPAVSGADVMGAMQDTQAAGQQMLAAESAGDEAQLSKARANFYVSLFNMANAITIGQMGPGGAQLNPQLQAMEPVFRQQFSADPKRLESLKVFGARWFAFPKRTNNGVVLAGTVESIDQVGPLFHAKIKPGEAATSAVTIVCAKDPQLAAGDEVLTLGSIVDKPAEELGGYEGSEPAVVWSGMTMKLSPAK